MQSENSFSMDSQATFSMPSEAEDPLRPGVTFDGFELTERLGRGGLGEVWKAYRADEKRFVALKFVPRDLLLYEEELLRVEGTFRKIESLHHENICPLYGMRRHPELGPYLVFRFLDGLTLNLLFIQKFLNCGKTMPLKLAVSILRPVAEALDYAHGKGLIHRDVKPGNIMLEMGRLKDGSLDFSRIRSVQLIDFGQAAFRSGLSRISMSEGTPPPPGTSGTVPFMSPEQFQGKPQDAQCDQYALAVTAYELLAGHLPFVSDDPQILTNCILNVQPDPIDDLPDSVNAALLRALAKDPAQRFLTCQEFIRALETPAKENDDETRTGTRSETRSETRERAGKVRSTQKAGSTGAEDPKTFSWSWSSGNTQTTVWSGDPADPKIILDTSSATGPQIRFSTSGDEPLESNAGFFSGISKPRLEMIRLAYQNELTKFRKDCINFGPLSSRAEQGRQEVLEAGAAAYRQVSVILDSAKKRHEELLAMGMLESAPDVKSVLGDIKQLTRFRETFTESEVMHHLQGGMIVEGGKKARREGHLGYGCGCGMPILLCGFAGLLMSITDYRNGVYDLLFEGICISAAFLLVGGGVVAACLWKLYRISREG